MRPRSGHCLPGAGARAEDRCATDEDLAAATSAPGTPTWTHLLYSQKEPWSFIFNGSKDFCCLHPPMHLLLQDCHLPRPTGSCSSGPQSTNLIYSTATRTLVVSCKWFELKCKQLKIFLTDTNGGKPIVLGWSPALRLPFVDSDLGFLPLLPICYSHLARQNKT